MTLLYNQAAHRTLAAYLSGGRFPHAILLEGPAGCGKYTFARIVAAAILCAGENRPCGECPHCRKVEKDIHPDVPVYRGEGGSRSFHIEVVRQIRQEAYVRPNEAESKVLILRDIHTMTPQAQNALLKMIEEPPRGVHFLCTCENKSALLPTVLSRVALISLEVPDTEQCREALAKLRPEADPQRQKAAAVQTRGNIGKALELLEQPEGASLYQTAQTLLFNAAIGNELEALTALTPYERNRAGFRELLVPLRAIATDLLLGKQQIFPELQRLHRRLSPLQAAGIIAIIDETDGALVQNGNGLLLTTTLCSRIRSAVSESM